MPVDVCITVVVHTPQVHDVDSFWSLSPILARHCQTARNAIVNETTIEPTVTVSTYYSLSE
jgi:hypothetical protein